MIKKTLYPNKGSRQILHNIICSVVFHGEGNHDRQNANHS